jgi:hypothetical protein
MKQERNTMTNSDIIDGVLQRVGQTLNAQLTISWSTKQTLEQYLEIIKDNDSEFDFDSFIEYVMMNSVEELMLSLEAEGASLLEENFSILDGDGEVLY